MFSYPNLSNRCPNVWLESLGTRHRPHSDSSLKPNAPGLLGFTYTRLPQLSTWTWRDGPFGAEGSSVPGSMEVPLLLSANKVWALGPSWQEAQRVWAALEPLAFEAGRAGCTFSVGAGASEDYGPARRVLYHIPGGCRASSGPFLISSFTRTAKKKL